MRVASSESRSKSAISRSMLLRSWSYLFKSSGARQLKIWNKSVSRREL